MVPCRPSLSTPYSNGERGAFSLPAGAAFAISPICPMPHEGLSKVLNLFSPNLSPSCGDYASHVCAVWGPMWNTAQHVGHHTFAVGRTAVPHLRYMLADLFTSPCTCSGVANPAPKLVTHAICCHGPPLDHSVTPIVPPPIHPHPRSWLPHATLARGITV